MTTGPIVNWIFIERNRNDATATHGMITTDWRVASQRRKVGPEGSTSPAPE
jgi:hypothetical protein